MFDVIVWDVFLLTARRTRKLGRQQGRKLLNSAPRGVLSQVGQKERRSSKTVSKDGFFPSDRSGFHALARVVQWQAQPFATMIRTHWALWNPCDSSLLWWASFSNKIKCAYKCNAARLVFEENAAIRSFTKFCVVRFHRATSTKNRWDNEIALVCTASKRAVSFHEHDNIVLDGLEQTFL